MRRSIALWVCVLWAFMTIAAPVRACNIPVFRYALERWPADAYEVVIFHRDRLAAPDQAVVAEWQKACVVRPGRPNCSVELVDVSQPLQGPLRDLWQAQMSPKLPWLVVRYPESDEDRPPVWTGRLTREIQPPLLDSPARRELARRLLQGDSAVWVLLESGDRKKDQAAADLLAKELRRLEKTLKLPHDDSQDTVPLLSELPLRIGFSVLRLAPDDPAERLLVAMLLRMEKKENAPAEPIVFPVFGRGRVLGGLAGAEITADAIQEVAEFLCGACSCLVKRLNPGLDLLLAADWEGMLDNPADVKPEPPAKGTLIPIPSVRMPAGSKADAEAMSPLERDDLAPGQSGRPLLPAMIAGVSVLVVASGIWVWRVRRRKNRSDDVLPANSEMRQVT